MHNFLIFIKFYFVTGTTFEKLLCVIHFIKKEIVGSAFWYNLKKTTSSTFYYNLKKCTLLPPLHPKLDLESVYIIRLGPGLFLGEYCVSLFTLSLKEMY